MKTSTLTFLSAFIICIHIGGCYSTQKEPSATNEPSSTVEDSNASSSEGGNNRDAPPADESEAPPNFLPPGADISIPSDKEQRQIENRPEPSQCSFATDKSGCAEDKDCPDQNICYCYPKGSVGSCSASDCVTDSDCGGEYCAATGAITGEDCSTRGLEYRCVTEDDKCVHSLDCSELGPLATCVFDRDLGHRICTEVVCPL